MQDATAVAQIVIGIVQAIVAFALWRATKHYVQLTDSIRDLTKENVHAARLSTRIAIQSDLSRRLYDINRILLNDPQLLSDLQVDYLVSSTNIKTHFTDMVLNLFADVWHFYRHEQAIDDEQFYSWKNTMKNTFRRPYVHAYWNAGKTGYPESFQQYIDREVL